MKGRKSMDHRFASFVRKEFHHVLRDKRTMLILLGMPLILLLLFGYAISTEMKGTRVAVVDFSKDEMTRRIIERFDENRYFSISASFSRMSELDEAFRKGDIDMALVFGEDFSARLRHGGRADVQLLTDGSEPNQASMRVAYASQIFQQIQQEESVRERPAMAIVPETRLLYNPQQRSEYNFVPGVIGVILLLICAMMSSIAIVREKEMGTMEVLLASSLSPLYIIGAKLVPYFTVSCVNLVTVLLMSVFLLRVPVAGSLLCFVGVSLLYIFVSLSLGLFISTLVRTQLAAMLLSLLLIIPTIYLSGMVFPIGSMPVLLADLSALVPTRWYIEAARKLMIQGVEARYVLKETVILAVSGLAFISASCKLFKRRLE